MQWKLQIIAFVSYLVTIIGGFALIPKEPALFGMGMIPGPLALFSGFGLPMIAALSIGMVLLRNIDRRKGINALVFGGGSIIIWALTFGLFY